ncbi:type VI secretion system lipoprotein TssJ [Chitinimonas arctica]|uniref:Type VI secretion system lipoprotein TssJ n=1 Tax=Chitinimonas arctica TaxID=2594795 RepID=A0A516SH75_9NEIS|nr:type VI secretion system lipoprotein TssJ [Chitinimonas arctica]QDQ27506.1 type VI secretion system lipoprotein TssJ [Chitinimonas arctica]
MKLPLPRLARWAAAALGALLLVGCASKPVTMDGLIFASPKVNPDASGRASPVVVKLFHLKSLANFQTSDFFSLYERPAQALGSDYVTVEEIVLTPGMKQRITRPLAPEVRYLALIAAFRDLENAQWRGTLDVSQGDKDLPLIIELSDNKVSIRTADGTRELEKLQEKLAEKRDEMLRSAEEEAKQAAKERAQQAVTKRLKRLPLP